MDQRGSATTQSPFENKDTCGGGREGDETNRGGGPAKGEDNRHRAWSSSLRTLTLIDSLEGRRSWSVDRHLRSAIQGSPPQGMSAALDSRRSTSHLPVNHPFLRCTDTRSSIRQPTRQRAVQEEGPHPGLETNAKSRDHSGSAIAVREMTPPLTRRANRDRPRQTARGSPPS